MNNNDDSNTKVIHIKDFWRDNGIDEDDTLLLTPAGPINEDHYRDINQLEGDGGGGNGKGSKSNQYQLLYLIVYTFAGITLWTLIILSVLLSGTVHPSPLILFSALFALIGIFASTLYLLLHTLKIITG